MHKRQVLTSAVGLSLLSLVALILYAATSSLPRAVEHAAISSDHQMASPVAASLEALTAVENRLAEKGLDGPVEVIGEIIAIYADPNPIDGGGGRIDYFVRDAVSGRVYELTGKNIVPKGLVSGDVVRVRGNAKSNTVEVAAGDSGDEGVTILNDAAIAPVQDDRSILVIPANFDNKNLICSESAIDATMFSESQDSVRTTYAEATNGLVSFFGEVLPETTIAFPSSDTNYTAWASALDNYAQSLGYNPTNYDHVMYVVPPNGTASGGYGDINGPRSWVFYCDYPDLFTHEIGHNVGLKHASTPGDEYGDDSDTMGGTQGNYEDFNAPHKDQMGWVPDVSVVDVSDLSSGSFTLSPVDFPVSSSLHPQMLRIPKPDTNEFYYVSYRVPEGITANMSSTYRNKVHIHTYAGSGYKKTFLIDTLNQGETFSDPSNGVTVVFAGKTADTATISIGSNCVAQAPTISVSPSSYSTNSVDTKTYSVSVSNVQSSSCNPETYDLSVAAPSGWTSTKSFPQQTVISGQTVAGSFTVTPPGSVTSGQYSIDVDVLEGSTSVADSHPTYNIDITAPSVPTNLQGSYSRKKVSLQWNASSDSGGVSHYNIYRNDVLAGTAQQTSYQDSFAASGSNIYTVSAVDNAGNESAKSTGVTVEVSGKGGKGGGGSDGGSTDDGGTTDPGGTKCTPGAQKKGEC